MTDFWKAKLAAWTHDPAEKAFVLMRGGQRPGADAATRRGTGHEQGTVKNLRDDLGIAEADFDRSADWIAAGADRPQWPEPKDAQHSPSWARVSFVKQPALIHPMTGDELALDPLSEIEVRDIEAVSYDHFHNLIESGPDGIDYRLTHLAFWRFGPEPALAAPEFGALWQRMPADSRIPDHSIWAHLDLVSAIAGAKLKGQPALLSMSVGPVQGFIAQARSVSDLWAGSHLLSSLVWAGLEVLCEELGPDAVIQPNLRGVAAVDRWILESVPNERRGEWRERFESTKAEWLKKSSDENPLFAATMPNKFSAIVPAASAEDIARRIEKRVREQARDWALEAARKLFGDSTANKNVWLLQIEEQMAGFPEVTWAIAEWPMPEDARENKLPSEESMRSLKSALGAFYPLTAADAPGFFSEGVWKVLNQEVELEGVKFFRPNSGLLYPAVHDLVERSLAAAKSCRPFGQLQQKGFRCTLCGEREWLTNDLRLLDSSAGARAHKTIWSAKAGSNGIKEGEHLCALCTLKRMWPNLFRNQLESVLETENVSRFVVSTHAMAIATSLEKALGEIENGSEDGRKMQAALSTLAQHVRDEEPAVLPKKLAKAIFKLGKDDQQIVRRIPGLLDRLRESDPLNDDNEGVEADRLVRQFLGERPETYYALLKMDGDKMGAWLSGGDASLCIRYEDVWHKSIRAEAGHFKSQNPELRKYMESPRANSPGRHSAISGALNDFSSVIVRHVVEECFKGKLIYAGGDDVLAMFSVDDLLPAIVMLRAAYSGLPVAKINPEWKSLRISRGFAEFNGRVYTMMGSKATASIGAIVAHSQAPLAAVLRDLDAAEKQAKMHKPGNADRDSFRICIQKRAGGEIAVTGKFHKKFHKTDEILGSASIEALIGLRDLLRKDVSRRAVYHSVEWLRELPAPSGLFPDWQEMVVANLGYQLCRQSSEHISRKEADSIAGTLVEAALANSVVNRDGFKGQGRTAKAVLEDLLVVAEFFARESRSTMAEAAR
jgi:CRISPR-associated protein Cmr2